MRSIKYDSTGVITNFFFTTQFGYPLSGMVATSPGLRCSYLRERQDDVIIGLTGISTTGVFTSGGFVEIDPSSMPGLYRVDLPNACFAAGSKFCVVQFTTPSGVIPPYEIPIVGYDDQNSVTMGLSSLPSYAPQTSGGLLTLGSGIGQIYTNSGAADSNLTQYIDQWCPTADIVGYPKVTISSGIGPGQLSLTTGTVAVKTAQLLSILSYVNNASLLLLDTTISTVISQTEYGLNGGNDQNPDYTGMLAILYNAANGNSSSRYVSKYDYSSQIVTLDSVPAFSGEVGHVIKIFAVPTNMSIINYSGSIEPGYSLRDATRLILSSTVAELSGAETNTIYIRDINDTKNRIVATVDNTGNRTSVTFNTT